MKLLMTTDTIGGVWSYALELSRALGAHGAEVLLASMGRLPAPDQRDEADSIANLTLVPSEYRLCWMENPWADVELAGGWLLDLASDFRPDVIHLNDYVHAALDWRAPVLLVGHSCVFSWCAAVKHAAPEPGWNRYHREVRLGLRSADLVVAPTRAMLSELSRHYLPLPRTEVIANGRSGQKYRPRPKRPIVLSAGRVWDPAKNLAILADVAPRIEWPVLLAGEHRHPDGGEQTVEGVHFLGRLSQSRLAEWFGCAAIYVLPARYEPFGLTALEAALSGCALVLGDIPSLREIWDDAALFVEPDDAEQIVAALVKLTYDEAFRNGLAMRARMRAVGFTSQKMAAEYWQAYQRLLHESQHKSELSREVTI